MAAEILRHQSSVACYGDNHSGRVWGLLRFLDLHKHLYRRKMLSYRRHGDEKLESGTKHLTSAHNVISTDQEPLLDKEVNLQVENKSGAKKKSSGKAHFLTLLYRKMTKKKDRKLKISSSASQVIRTLSIHHLECNDYVLSDSITSDGDYVLSDSITSDGDSSPTTGSEKVAPSPRGSEGAFNTKRLKDVIKENRKKEHQISMDGVLDKIPIDHNISDNAGGEKRCKFGSEGFVYAHSKFAQRSIRRSHSLTETGAVREPQRLHRRSISFKEGDNSFADRRFLPSHSLTESLDRYSHLLESMPVREPQRLKQRLNSLEDQEDNIAHRRVLRSHSVSESFDVYSRLLEYVSFGEPQRLPRRSKSVKEQDNTFAQRRALQSRSLTDSFNVTSGLLESVSFREPQNPPERLKSVSDEDNLLSDRGIELDSFCNNVPSEMPALSPKKRDAVLLAVDVEADTSSSDEPDAASVHVDSEEILGTFECHNEECTFNGTIGVLNQPELINVHDQTEHCIISADLTANDGSSDRGHENENDIKEDPSDKPAKPSLMSVFDYHKSPVIQDAELQPRWINFEEHDFDADSDNKIEEFIDKTDTGDVDISYVKKEEAEFNFVKDVLKKSGFGGGAQEFRAAWCSSYEPIDQLLFVDEFETMRDDYLDIPLDHQLLLDLINKVLLDIYESIVACSMGLSRFSPQIRPMPVGDHVLEEVWAKVRCHLSSQQHTNTLEQAMARDFAKNDGWMNLALNVETVGIELADSIIDDLVDEIIVDA